MDDADKADDTKECLMQNHEQEAISGTNTNTDNNIPYRIGIIRVRGGWKTLTNEGKTK